ncbi:MAG: ASKHA domain-containing protein [Acidobacteria bacterium]|nr:ASKHA domain-containing protein [Acidobacteriota bacterium]
MPRVEFLPLNVVVEVLEGTLLHDAALAAGLHDLELPCGGQGTCGQCLVEIVNGQGEPRRVLACQTPVRGDVIVRIPENLDTAMEVVGDSTHLAPGEVPTALSPLFDERHLTGPAATIDQPYSDWQRTVRELGLPAIPELSVLQTLSASLREDQGRITLDLAGERVTGVRPGHAAPEACGLAIDIGTTTIAVQLVRLADGSVLGTATSYNRQARRGADIISRIDYARTPERLAEVRSLAVDTINGLIAELDAPTENLRAAFLAGNTTMTHLLLGLPPRYIRESPYVPTVQSLPAFPAAGLGLQLAADAVVQFAPGVGSYVGGDITAGLLATPLVSNHDDVFLFLDIGTNGEIVIGNADWLVACACSAGPAFEGAGIRCGMRATPGAIERVEINDGRLAYEVIGGGKPAGLCGSGLICLLGELFLAGLIDAAGHFHSAPDRAFVIETAANTATGEDLVITETDIENLIRTKGAIYAACSLILENVGLDWDAVARVCVAGGFGRYLRIADAVSIGMLPDLPHGRFSYIGNAALTGARLALLFREHRQRLHGSLRTGTLSPPHRAAALPECGRKIENFESRTDLMKTLMERIAQGDILISDGAMGTFLHAKGLTAGECPESWCVSHPDVVRGIAEAYAGAGADIVETNSFGGSAFKLKAYGLADKTVEFNRAAAALAKEAVTGRGYVAASVGPTGHISEEEGGDVTEQQLYDVFKEQVVALAEGGADAICVETMSSLTEAAAAIRAAKENTSLPVICTFTFEAGAKGFRTMMGARPDRAAKAAVAAGADIVGANCGNGIVNMIEITRQIRAAVPSTPILIHANAGAPVVEDGKTCFKETPEFVASRVQELVAAGANIIGGCCGTNPSHIAAMAKAVK